MTFNPCFTRPGGNVCHKNYNNDLPTCNFILRRLSPYTCARRGHECKSIKLVSPKIGWRDIEFAVVIATSVSFCLRIKINISISVRTNYDCCHQKLSSFVIVVIIRLLSSYIDINIARAVDEIHLSFLQVTDGRRRD